jgi:hypothetical protein
MSHIGQFSSVILVILERFWSGADIPAILMRIAQEPPLNLVEKKRRGP